MYYEIELLTSVFLLLNLVPSAIGSWLSSTKYFPSKCSSSPYVKKFYFHLNAVDFTENRHFILRRTRIWMICAFRVSYPLLSI